MKAKPTAPEIAAARGCVPRYVPPTSEYRNGWMVTGPRGNELYYDTEHEAADAAATGIY
jgi:hypothetical protein